MDALCWVKNVNSSKGEWFRIHTCPDASRMPSFRLPLIKDNNPNISLALDAIPPNVSVSKVDYLKYIERFKRAFPKGRDGLPMASRLLAMKRPDLFLCIDSKNESKLYESFGILKAIKRKDYEKYWDLIIVPLMASPWWKSPPPSSGIEREVWQARAAFLDCLYYEGVDLPDAIE